MKLSEALVDISEVLTQIEDLDGEDIPDSLIPKWHLAVENLQASVDTRAFQIRQVQSMQVTLDAMIKSLQVKKKNFARYESRLLTYTHQVLQENPSLEFKGKHSSFLLCSNSSRPIKYSVTFQKPPILIDPYDASAFPPQFITQAQFFVLDKERFETALRAGDVTCAGAELGEKGTHVRVK